MGHWMCGLSNGAAALALKHGGAPPRLGLRRGERTCDIDLLACSHDYATYPFVFFESTTIGLGSSGMGDTMARVPLMSWIRDPMAGAVHRFIKTRDLIHATRW